MKDFRFAIECQKQKSDRFGNYLQSYGPTRWKIRMNFQWKILIETWEDPAHRESKRYIAVKIKVWNWFWYKTKVAYYLDRWIIDQSQRDARGETPEEGSQWAIANGFRFSSYERCKAMETAIISAFDKLDELYKRNQIYYFSPDKERFNNYRNQVLSTYWQEQKAAVHNENIGRIAEENWNKAHQESDNERGNNDDWGANPPGINEYE